METEDNRPSITCLPSEVISLILQYNSCREILNFSETCKVFNETVKENQWLWKKKLKYKIPVAMVSSVEKYCDGDWLFQLKYYFKIKASVYEELMKMSALNFWMTRDDIGVFFAIALSSNLSYYYVIHTLQALILKGEDNLRNQIFVKPYTLTELYYAKNILRHLIHTFLSVKWVKCHINNELTPLTVVNFFVQWVDTLELYPDDDVDNKIQELVNKINVYMDQNENGKSSSKILPKSAKHKLSQIEILNAISQVIFHKPHMVVMPTPTVATLNIFKVARTKCGNVVLVAAIYQAVAKLFGVTCELVAFPNHLFLEWRDHSGDKPRVYVVDLSTGELHPKRTCPYAAASTAGPRYSPDALLKYIYSTFHFGTGEIKNGYTQNAMQLLVMMSANSQSDCPYRNFLPYLTASNRKATLLEASVDIKDINYVSSGLIRTLSNMNRVGNYKRQQTRKIRDGRVRFAVGMVCYHRQHEYACAVLAWDTSCAFEWRGRLPDLSSGFKQPFYQVLASDQSHRYVAQEWLYAMHMPSRLEAAEEQLGRHFSHFDGYSYVPNEQKEYEYPQDSLIRAMYRERSQAYKE